MAGHDQIGLLLVATLGAAALAAGPSGPAQTAAESHGEMSKADRRRSLPPRRVVYIDSTNEEEAKVSPLMKRVSFPIALALLCGVAACATGPPKTDAEQQADKETAERVETALNADKALYAKHISVRADNGVVRLTGYVWNASDFQTAVIIAEGVQGVTGVVNNLELNRNGNDNGPVAR